jgi:hypothetical protein
MGQELHYCRGMGLNGKLAYIFKFARDDVGTGSRVEEIAIKAKSTLRGGDYPDIERSSEALWLAVLPDDSPNPWKEHLGPVRSLISAEAGNGT